MAIIKLGKKKETPCCGGNENSTPCACNGNAASDTKNARFIVLGACCQKSTDTFNNVKQAVKELGIDAEVMNIGDDMEIARYGVMQTPGLVVDGRVVSYGKLLKVEDVKKIFGKLHLV